MFTSKKVNLQIVIAVLVLALLIGFFAFQNSRNSRTSGKTSAVTDNKVAPALARVAVDKSWMFPIPAAIKASGDVKFTITTAEKKDQLKVKNTGTKATSGKDYLLLRLEIDNPSTERIKFMSSDFIRLVAGDKKYAPDFHNGVINLDPISTRKDLVAFSVGEETKKFIFQIGELSKDKETIEIEFK